MIDHRILDRSNITPHMAKGVSATLQGRQNGAVLEFRIKSNTSNVKAPHFAKLALISVG